MEMDIAINYPPRDGSLIPLLSCNFSHEMGPTLGAIKSYNFLKKLFFLIGPEPTNYFGLANTVQPRKLKQTVERLSTVHIACEQ